LRRLKVDGHVVNTNSDQTISLTLSRGKDVVITYEALFNDKQVNFIDKEHVFLTEKWYPQPNVLAEYALSVTLPQQFIAVSESEAVTIQKHGKTQTFYFQFNHPLDALHLAASTRYVLKKDRHDNIAIEAYFFKEDAHLADIYISYTKKYLKMYETMLAPYPYQRFAIVEHILPAGLSMPTYTLLGQQVVRLPFIVKTSLGHEILHQWFGNSVYIDDAHGNWAEGLTTYLADHHYAAMKEEDTIYRKQIMIDYSAYVNKDNAISVSDFSTGYNKALRAVGYGKVAMLFHGLRERYGDENFFAALKEFIFQNSFRSASWHDIQRAFEKVTGKKLYEYFDHWLSRTDIPQLHVETSNVQVERGQLKLNLLLMQKRNTYPLRIPITLYEGSVKRQQVLEVNDEKSDINLTLDHLPSKVVIDENYTFMRQLTAEEIPPVISSVIGKNRLTVVVTHKQRTKYQPLIDALAGNNVTYVSPSDIAFSQLQDHSFLIVGYGNALVEKLFGKHTVPDDGVRIKVYKNPYNTADRMALLHVQNEAEARAIQQKIMHYGKYTELAFNQGKNTYKATAEASRGILVWSRPATRALKPSKTAELNHILPELMDSRIIYIGERHDNFAHHINQLFIIKKIHESGKEIAVGMEMFQKPYQHILSDYIAGHIDELTFLRQTEYYTRWKYDYNLYKPIIDYLKQHKIPLIALNITGDITQKAAREGIYSLSDEKKQQIPASMDFSNEQYRVDLSEVYALHDDQKELENFNYFLQAQTLWDEAMAETAHQFLVNNPTRQLVVLAGNGHLRYKYGIPERLHRRNHEPYKVIVQDEEIENDIADYVLLTIELKGKKSPKLGVMVEEKDQTLVIKGVESNGPAKKAGLQKGDIIEQFDTQPITSLVDLKLALFYSEYGNVRDIQVKRDGKTLTKKIELFQIKTLFHSLMKEKPKERKTEKDEPPMGNEEE
ncbi:MAG: ChaN family lipoprotein, partial [Desulfobacterales bacterium]